MLNLSDFKLSQNYPNPFNTTTVLSFAIPQSGDIELVVFNLAGQKLMTLVNEHRKAGQYSVKWDGRDGKGRELASGVYLYQLRTRAQIETRKLLLIR